LAGRRLLVIEDNATNQKIVRHRAEQWGMVVEVAGSAQEGLARLRQCEVQGSESGAQSPGAGGFDVVLLDLELPVDVPPFPPVLAAGAEVVQGLREQGHDWEESRRLQDGLAVAEEIRRLPAGRYLPLVLLSSVRLRSDDGRPGALGISLFVHKPIRPAQLLDGLCRALSVQVQREKKSAAPVLDANFARRLPLRVLLADDNAINLKVGLSVLQRLGYRAEVANNGLEVLKALEVKPYDVLFLDVQMPEMDGLECAREICRRWSRDRRPVVVAMTGNALMGDREKCLAAGMDDYISKPVQITELQSALERWGPTKSRKFDTNYFLRYPHSLTSGLVDEVVIGELRRLPPSEGGSMLGELIDLFLESAPARITQLHEFAGDPPKLAFHAHALKSMSLNLGCTGIIGLAQRLEELGRAGEVKGAQELIRELEGTFRQTKAQLLILRTQDELKGSLEG
jgi:CheY-like chemotaxis protein/HPt (histidine-containing phosphotransfer) domain-containing protein